MTLKTVDMLPLTLHLEHVAERNRIFTTTATKTLHSNSKHPLKENAWIKNQSTAILSSKLFCFS